MSVQFGSVECCISQHESINLIESGANVSVKDFHDFTCLHYAALYGWKDVLDAILHADAEISPTTVTGATPLMLACSRGHHHIVTTLLEEGGDDAGIEHRDGAGEARKIERERQHTLVTVPT